MKSGLGEVESRSAPVGDQAGQRGWQVWLLTGVSIAGTADIAQFLVGNSGMFSTAPGRAAGSVLGLLFWIGLTVLAFSLALGTRSRLVLGGTLWVASLLTVGSLALAAVHAAAGVGGLRPALGAILALLAIVLVVRLRGS